MGKITENYRDRLEEGLAYQDFISIELGIICFASQKYQGKEGESRVGIEVKLDNRLSDTDNVYIETYEKRNGDNPNWVESGILRDDNSCLWIIGDYYTAYLFTKKQLLNVYQQIDKYNFRQVETETSKGFLIPRPAAAKYAVKEIAF